MLHTETVDATTLALIKKLSADEKGKNEIAKKILLKLCVQYTNRVDGDSEFWACHQGIMS